MNRVDKEFNKIVLLADSTDNYERAKFALLLHQCDDPKLRDYLRKLFNFTDRHRPLLLEMKAGVA